MMTNPTEIEDFSDRMKAIAEKLKPAMPALKLNVGLGAKQRDALKGLSSLRFVGPISGVTKKFAERGDGFNPIRRPVAEQLAEQLTELRTLSLPDDLGEWVPPLVPVIDLLQDLVEIQQAEHEANEKRSRRTERWAIVAAATGVVGCLAGIVQLIA